MASCQRKCGEIMVKGDLRPGSGCMARAAILSETTEVQVILDMALPAESWRAAEPEIIVTVGALHI